MIQHLLKLSNQRQFFGLLLFSLFYKQFSILFWPLHLHISEEEYLLNFKAYIFTTAKK